MKKLFGLNILLLVLLSCSQKQQDCSNGQLDSGESGVDCGGVCPPCPIANPPNNNTSTLQSLQGVWHYSHYKTGTSYIGDQTSVASTDNNCKFEFTTTSTIPGLYDMFGNMQSICTYPTLSYYNYNASTNLINTNILVESVNNDSLHLSYGGGSVNNAGFDFYHVRTDPSFGATENINWEVTLANPYPNNNELEIRLSGGGITPVTTLVPIIAGQVYYSGVISLNMSYLPYPFINLSVQNKSGSPNNPDTLSFSSKLSLGGIVSEQPNHLFCLGTPCTIGSQLTTGMTSITFY